MSENFESYKERALLDKTSGKIYKNYKEMIDDYILRCVEKLSRLRKKTVKYRLVDEDGYGVITFENVDVGVNVIEKGGVIVVLAELMEVPNHDQEQFFRRLLELNFLETHEGSFCINKDNNTVCMKALRRIEELDYDEFEDIVDTIITVSNYWLNVLSIEY